MTNRSRAKSLRREAADLVARVAHGAPAVDEKQLLARWSHRGAADLRALKDMAGIWNDTGALRRTRRYAELMGRPTWHERRAEFQQRIRALPAASLWAGIGVAAATLCAVVLGCILPDLPVYYSGVPPKDIALADGSVIRLFAKTEMEVRLESRLRFVRLIRGSARFSIAHDPNRPLIIESGDTQVRVVGTQFDLTYQDGCTMLAVLEGVVRVTSPGAAPRNLIAAEETASSDRTTSSGGCLSTRMRNLARLSYRGAPLSVVIADAERFYGKSIVLSSPEVASEKITTSFTLAQIDQMLQSLSISLHLQIVRSPDGAITLDRKD